MSENLDNLCQWLQVRHAQGDSLDQLLNACMRSGWDGHTAIQAVEKALGILLEPAKPVPTLQLDQSGRRLIDGRNVQQIFSVHVPDLAVIRDFLSNSECDELIEHAKAYLRKSVVIDKKTGIQHLDQRRSSSTAVFHTHDSALLKRIDHRIAALLDWPLSWGESLQVQHYQQGQEYAPHYDYCPPDTAGIEKLGGQRVATFLMYLNEPQEGGGTSFNDIGLTVDARKGSAVFFTYDRPYPTSKTLHAGMPVLAGEKWIATKWLHAEEVKRKTSD